MILKGSPAPHRYFEILDFFILAFFPRELLPKRSSTKRISSTMDSTLGLFQGLLGPLTHDRSAYADGTAGYIPPIPGSRAFFKVYTGLDHGDFTDAGGDQPDARCK